MQVEFFEGARCRRAYRANTDELCAVKVVRLRNAAMLEVDRWLADLEMTDAVVREAYERWKQELPVVARLKRRPREMSCSGPSSISQDSLHTTLFVTCGWGRLEGWKEFLAELLSRPESWRSHREERVKAAGHFYRMEVDRSRRMSFPTTREEMEAVNYVRNGTEACKGCGASIEFWITPQMKAIPMNPMPKPTSTAISHLATCPYAARFRRSKS